MRVEVDGALVYSWEDMFGALGVADSSWAQDLTNGRVLPAQSSLNTLSAAGGERAARVRDAYLTEAPRLAFELCYCSVYGECWRLRQRGLDSEREPVGVCEEDLKREILY
ncbi:MAG: hypothetical protein ABJF88_12935 [Rhodothermales bacterium]